MKTMRFHENHIQLAFYNGAWIDITVPSQREWVLVDVKTLDQEQHLKEMGFDDCDPENLWHYSSEDWFFDAENYYEWPYQTHFNYDMFLKELKSRGASDMHTAQRNEKLGRHVIKKNLKNYIIFAHHDGNIVKLLKDGIRFEAINKIGVFAKYGCIRFPVCVETSLFKFKHKGLMSDLHFDVDHDKIEIRNSCGNTQSLHINQILKIVYVPYSYKETNTFLLYARLNGKKESFYINISEDSIKLFLALAESVNHN